MITPESMAQTLLSLQRQRGVSDQIMADRLGMADRDWCRLTGRYDSSARSKTARGQVRYSHRGASIARAANILRVVAAELGTTVDEIIRHAMPIPEATEPDPDSQAAALDQPPSPGTVEA